MSDRPVVLIHGYSDKAESFLNWRDALNRRGFGKVALLSYETLVNEISIKDIAEGFERALRIQAGLDEDQEFDAIVHSTGMLVLRCWLVNYARRRSRLKHLIALAPATFGSPLAHKGRSWLGAIFKGRKELGPDFMEAGNQVLDALELGSRFTWDLAERDMVGEKPFYGKDASTPYVFVFCGNTAYGGLRRLVNEPGTDGTVRWAGCALNTRKIVLDFTEAFTGSDRASVAPWSNLEAPLMLVDGVNHGTILARPPDRLVNAVAQALTVSSESRFKAWSNTVRGQCRQAAAKVHRWQQFVVRAVDERGDPIPDYHVELLAGRGKKLEAFDVDVHVYGADKSLRCFHVDLDRLSRGKAQRLRIRILVSSGSDRVSYFGVGSEKRQLAGVAGSGGGKWDGQFDFSSVLERHGNRVGFFFPFTTTLVEIRLDREPMPLEGPNRVAWFLDNPPR